MTIAMQQIIQHLFRVNSLAEVPRERLEELVSRYPSFSVGHYLLSRKLHTEDAGHFSEETQKTNLYFSNPFWLHWLLQNEAEEQKPAYARPPAAAANIAAEETMVEDEQSWGMPDVMEPVPGKGAATVPEPVVDGETVLANEFPTVPETAAGEEQEPAGESFFQEKLGIEAEAPAAPETAHSGVSAAAPTAAEALLQSLEEARSLRQALVEMNETRQEEPVDHDPIAPVEAGLGEAPVASQLEDIPAEARVEDVLVESRSDEAPAEGGSEDIQTEARQDDVPAETRFDEAPGGVVSIAESRAEEGGGAGHEKDVEEQAAEQGVEQQVVEQVGPGAPESSVTSVAQESSVTALAQVVPVAALAQAVPEAEPIVEFEPYHTIDYFASVGIKLIQEDNPSDKLGKQLKSFTEWLKVMRKLPQKNQEIVPDGAVEHQIQAIAAHSIKGKEILTETMAEVLVKQGMREKAMDVYHKLSLLNPDKSAYFATKIEQLKID